MFENIVNFFRKLGKNEKEDSKTTAKERLHLVLAQDRANISADFLEMMKQEIIEVIKKYVDIDEGAIDVRMTNKPGEDGTVGAPALYANIPIVTIKNEARKLEGTLEKQKIEEDKKDDSKDKESQEGQTKADKESVESVETASDKSEEDVIKEEIKTENQKVKPDNKPENKEIKPKPTVKRITTKQNRKRNNFVKKRNKWREEL